MDKAKLKEILEKYAKSQGIRLNPDEKIVDLILEGLLNNEKKYGYRYCPCRRVTGDKAVDAKIICPCIYHKEEIKSMGKCHCGLFVSIKD
ncbi:MAG: ferredoxin-thioredoxin reductase catalytic domain-containing protein [Candidatus Bathyarchaeia archaeon]